MDWGDLAIVGAAFALIALAAVGIWRIRSFGGRPRRNHWVGGFKGGGHFTPDPPGYDDLDFEEPSTRAAGRLARRLTRSDRGGPP